MSGKGISGLNLTHIGKGRQKMSSQVPAPRNEMIIHALPCLTSDWICGCRQGDSYILSNSQTWVLSYSHRLFFGEINEVLRKFLR